MKKISPKPKKKAKKVKPTAKPMTKREGKLIGKITHYFSNIGVGVIAMSGSLATGDEIRIVGGESTDFNQTADSLQVDHQEVKKAKKGDDVGLKVKEKVREGYKVYKV